jgi:hypothetical protein
MLILPARRSKVASGTLWWTPTVRALKLHVYAADIQDRDGAGPLLRASRSRWPSYILSTPMPAKQCRGGTCSCTTTGYSDMTKFGACCYSGRARLCVCPRTC